jgi:hypothetical protein
MKPLDQGTIPFLRRKLEKEGLRACPPYAIDYGETVVVTNGGILLEWPADLVDRECSQFQKLLANAGHTLAKTELLKDRDWQDVLLHPDGVFGEAVEAEPERREGFEGCLIFKCDDTSFYYHYTNFDVVEYFVERAGYSLYLQPPDQNLDERMKMMAVFQPKAGPIGVFTNQILL